MKEILLACHRSYKIFFYYFLLTLIKVFCHIGIFSVVEGIHVFFCMASGF